MDFTSKIGGFSFENPLMNASGVHCFDGKDLDELAASPAGSFVTKSATLHSRAGNPEPRCVPLAFGSINSMGLPNLGLDFYLNYCIDYQKDTNHKNHFLSAIGMSFEESLQILKKIQNSDFQGITELNLSCPNVPGKPQIGYDFQTTEKLLENAFGFFRKPLGVKLPPYFDFADFDKMAELFNRFPLSHTTCINSVGNGIFIDLDKEQVVIKPKDGFGGIGGEYVKPTALANVRAFRTRLKPDISVIGCGGVTCGKDVFEHLLCGASLVQIGTQLLKEGVSVFNRLLTELQQVMEEKGYNSIEDFRGKLKTL